MVEQMNDCLYQLEDKELHCSELINEKNEMKEVFRQRLVAYNKQKNINLMLNRLLHFHQKNHHHHNSEGRYERRSGYTGWLLFVMMLLLVIWLLLFLTIFLYLKLLSSDPVLFDRILK
jgi:hypothetical protein